MKSSLLKSALASLAHPLAQSSDLDPLVQHVSQAKVVMLGEASHGTKEFYQWRALLTQRLIEEKGFQFIAVEGDWPDCYRIHQYLKKGSLFSPEKGKEVLRNFRRWPTWLWANEETLKALKQLKAWNYDQPPLRKVGFFGLDIYSLWESLEAILKYLQGHSPELLDQARQVYHCFEPFERDAYRYAGGLRFGNPSCEEEVAQLLSNIRKNWMGSQEDQEGYFNLEQNALILKNAEHYYRILLKGEASSWNERDNHMFDTLERLLNVHGENANAIVWAHNTHIGDARYTSMRKAKLINLGQLARERYGKKQVALVGMGAYEGNVIAARQWEGPMKRMPLPPAKRGSLEALMHEISPENKLFLLGQEEREKEALNRWIPQRAVGVVYTPEQEQGNYVPSLFPKRYDAFLYFEHTQALDPLDVGELELKEIPETYPFSI